jgi:hypothetical protein
MDGRSIEYIMMMMMMMMMMRMINDATEFRSRSSDQP